MEESIVNKENRNTVKRFQKSITYRWWHGSYQKPWQNDDITDKIIRKIVEENGFVRNHSDVEELESSEDESEFGKVKELAKKLKGDEDVRTEGKIRLMLEKGYELIEIETNEVIRNILINDEIDLQGLREKLEKGELPLRIKGKAVLKDKNDNEKERAIIIAEKWIEKGHVNVTIGGIMRLLKLGYDELRLENDREFIDRYIEYNDLLDDELMTKLNELDDEMKIEERLERLKNLIKVLEIEVSDGELLRLISMEYRDVDILSTDFIKLFQEYKNESEKEIKRILDEYLKKFEIEESEEEVEEENDNTDDSEKSGEILSPEEHEIWEENTEDFNENEIGNNNENVINTEGFGLSQNSDSNNPLNTENSDIEEFDTEKSDYNLRDLFQENILLNMGATRAEVREDFRAALLAATGHDIGGNWAGLVAADPLANAIENAGNVAGGIVNMPLFYGKEDEDVNDWIRQFEIAFTAIGKERQANGTRQAAFAATCLRGAAVQWYNGMKEANDGNLTNWENVDNDNDLKHRIIRKFTREDVKRKKMVELAGMRQGINESVEEYTRRFRAVLRIATRGQVLHDVYQVNYFIQGLEPVLGYQVRRSNPATLDEAIDTAKREGEAMNELSRRTGVNIGQSSLNIGQEKNMEEILKEEANKYKKMNPIAKELQNKEVKNNEIEELIKGFKRMEAHMLKINENNRRPMRNNNRNNVDWSKATCYTCGKQGHTSKFCRENQRGMNRRNNQVNHLDEDYDEEYDAYNMGYDDEYDEYENNEYDAYEMENEDDIEENDIYPALIRRSERNKDKVMNDERDRRRNAKWQEQEQRVQGNRKGFTQEQRQKAQETRRRNSLCQNCGQYGHFTTECKNEKVRLNRRVPNTEEFDPVKGFMNSNVPINWGQYISERPGVGKKLRNGLKY
ncbi:unnamed protein product [Rhizophagus irregularis]|nr:unnamed protein product [Rhizophagus irregularis]